MHTTGTAHRVGNGLAGTCSEPASAAPGGRQGHRAERGAARGQLLHGTVLQHGGGADARASGLASPWTPRRAGPRRLSARAQPPSLTAVNRHACNANPRPEQSRPAHPTEWWAPRCIPRCMRPTHMANPAPHPNSPSHLPRCRRRGAQEERPRTYGGAVGHHLDLQCTGGRRGT